MGCLICSNCKYSTESTEAVFQKKAHIICTYKQCKVTILIIEVNDLIVVRTLKELEAFDPKRRDSLYYSTSTLTWSFIVILRGITSIDPIRRGAQLKSYRTTKLTTISLMLLAFAPRPPTLDLLVSSSLTHFHTTERWYFFIISSLAGKIIQKYIFSTREQILPFLVKIRRRGWFSLRLVTELKTRRRGEVGNGFGQLLKIAL